MLTHAKVARVLQQVGLSSGRTHDQGFVLRTRKRYKGEQFRAAKYVVVSWTPTPRDLSERSNRMRLIAQALKLAGFSTEVVDKPNSAFVVVKEKGGM